MKVIRCLLESDFHDIKRGTYHPNSVPVYYGFNCYNDSVEHINKLVEIIKSEMPMMTEKDMHITYILPSQSIRHAHHTMIWVDRVPSKVKAGLLEDYTIL
jgi:hypothetical protein